jgi:hypothetical protein
MDERVQINSERQQRQRRDAVRSYISGRGAGETGGVNADDACNHTGSTLRCRRQS